MKERAFAPSMPMTPMSSSKVTAFPSVGLAEVSIELIDENPFGPREVYLPEVIGEMANALRDQGQHDPIHIRPNPDAPGRFIICDGWTRVQACLRHKVFETLKAIIHPELDETESGWFGYQQNEERNQHFDYDRARFFQKMIDSGMTSAEVARRAGISEPLMSNYKAFSKLPEPVLTVVRRQPERFSASVVYQLSRTVAEHGERKAASDAIWFADNPSKTREALIAKMKTRDREKSGKPPAPTKHLRFANGSYKWNGERVRVDLRVPEEELDLFEREFDALVQRIGKPVPIEEAEKKREEDFSGLNA